MQDFTARADRDAARWRGASLLGLHRLVIFATAIWEVARDMHFAFNSLDVVDGFGVTALAGLLSVNGHA
jgi:hypothetical protein